MKSFFMSLAVLLAVGGCANDRVEGATPWGGTVQYDHVFSRESNAFKLAEAHCQTYGKNAVPRGEPYGWPGSYENQNYDCKPWSPY